MNFVEKVVKKIPSRILIQTGIRRIFLHKANHVHLMRNQASVFLIVLDDDVPWHI